jgi:hypothetical protein
MPVSFFKKIFSRSNAPSSSGSEDRTEIEFPFPLEAVSGKEAPERLDALIFEGGAGGFLPVMVGDAESALGVAANRMLVDRTPEAILDAALKVDLDQWMIKTASSDGDWYDAVEGDWPKNDHPTQTLVAHKSALTRRPLKEVYIARIPAVEWWEIPAYLGTGGWNECPEPEVHVAFFKRAFDRYGAEPRSMTADIVEFVVKNPPTTHDEALELARAHFVYCPDIVHQGTQTLKALASTLVNAPIWYFWWD